MEEAEKTKVNLRDIVMGVMAQLNNWEPVGKQALEMTVTTADGFQFEILKSVQTIKSHGETLQRFTEEAFESALAETNERHGGALKKLADK